MMFRLIETIISQRLRQEGLRVARGKSPGKKKLSKLHKLQRKLSKLHKLKRKLSTPYSSYSSAHSYFLLLCVFKGSCQALSGYKPTLLVSGAPPSPHPSSTKLHIEEFPLFFIEMPQRRVVLPYPRLEYCSLRRTPGRARPAPVLPYLHPTLLARLSQAHQNPTTSHQLRGIAPTLRRWVAVRGQDPC
jgi:hypothetical protein